MHVLTLITLVDKKKNLSFVCSFSLSLSFSVSIYLPPPPARWDQGSRQKLFGNCSALNESNKKTSKQPNILKHVAHCQKNDLMVYFSMHKSKTRPQIGFCFKKSIWFRVISEISLLSLQHRELQHGVLKPIVVVSTCSRAVTRYMCAAMFCLDRLSLAALYWVVSRFFVIQQEDSPMPLLRAICQGHESGNCSILSKTMVMEQGWHLLQGRYWRNLQFQNKLWKITHTQSSYSSEPTWLDDLTRTTNVPR